MIIEVYILRSKDLPENSVLYREIPTGVEATPYSRPPDYVFNVAFKPGHGVHSRYGVTWYILTHQRKQ